MALPPLLVGDDLARFRSTVCDRFVRFGVCKFKEKCQYSHCISWRRRNPLRFPYKPQLCPNVKFSKTNEGKTRVSNACPVGRRCRFSHSKEEQMFHPQIYKTVLCQDFPKCMRYYCPFAHGEEELRNPQADDPVVAACLALPDSGMPFQQTKSEDLSSQNSYTSAAETEFSLLVDQFGALYFQNQQTPPHTNSNLPNPSYVNAEGPPPYEESTFCAQVSPRRYTTVLRMNDGTSNQRTPVYDAPLWSDFRKPAEYSVASPGYSHQSNHEREIREIRQIEHALNVRQGGVGVPYCYDNLKSYIAQAPVFYDVNSEKIETPPMFYEASLLPMYPFAHVAAPPGGNGDMRFRQTDPDNQFADAQSSEFVSPNGNEQNCCYHLPQFMR
eukprot:Filipodium_phascolosomae@DN6820_c0_g1_i1.p1